MLFKKKKVQEIDITQKEMFEHAQQRIKQKKRLYRHFVIFLLGSFFMILMNLVLKIGGDTKIMGIDWFVYGVLIWSFLMLFHTIDVIFFKKFMGKEWEAKQMKRLVEKQKKRIAQMEEQLGVRQQQQLDTTKTIIYDKNEEA
ncbi:2TM domain-containing protein [Aquimarina rhabdastrellae]